MKNKNNKENSEEKTNEDLNQLSNGHSDKKKLSMPLSYRSENPIVETTSSTKLGFAKKSEQEVPLRNKIVDGLKEKELSTWAVSKLFNISYTKAWAILRDLEFARIIVCREGFNSQGDATKFYSVPKIKEGEK